MDAILEAITKGAEAVHIPRKTREIKIAIKTQKKTLYAVEYAARTTLIAHILLSK